MRGFSIRQAAIFTGIRRGFRVDFLRAWWVKFSGEFCEVLVMIAQNWNAFVAERVLDSDS